MDLLELRVYGQITKKTTIGFTGPQVRGFFLNLIKDINEELASKLHNPGKPAPYSIKPISEVRYVKKSDREIYNYILKEENIEEGKIVSFSISLLSKEVQNYWYQILEKILYNGIVRVGKLDILVKSVKVNRLELKILDTKRFIVKFNTPTFFRRKGNPYKYLFPDPVILFTNIARIWNSVSDDEINIESLTEIMSSNVGVLMHRIKTSKSMDIGEGRRVIGFIGRCIYESADKNASKIISRLLSIAEYTNVGGSRSLGFGAIEWIPKKE